MANTIHQCLSELRQQLAPNLSLPSTIKASSPEPNFSGRAVRVLKLIGSRFTSTLRTLGVMSTKPINEREIERYRWVRSIAGAGLVDEHFYPTVLPEHELLNRAETARILWHKDPYEFALWCIDTQKPFPQAFVMTELIPWQMEELVDSGMSRKLAARWSLELCLAVHVIQPNQINKNTTAFASHQKEVNATNIERHEKMMADTLQQHQLESAEEYVDSMTHLTPTKQIVTLRACCDELAVNHSSHSMNPAELIKKVTREHPESLSSPIVDNSVDLIDFTS